MTKNRIRQRANKKKKQLDEKLSTKNPYGQTDYTPYNAITGNDIISVGRVTDPVSKVPGRFNTTKK